MGKSKHRKRRHRRQAHAYMKFGSIAKPSHKLISGRTGIAHSKKMATRQPK